MVLGSYYPNPSPTAIVADQIARFYAKTHNVSIICQGDYVEKKDNCKRNNENRTIKIYKLGNPIFFLEKAIEKGCRDNDENQRKKYQLISKVLFPFRMIKNLILFPNGEKWYIRKARKKIEEIYQESGIDYLFTVCAPFSAHIAGYKFKKSHHDINWCVYTPDVFTEGIMAQRDNIYKKIKYIRAQKWEDKVYSSADCIIHMDRIYDRHEKEKSDKAKSIILYTKMDFSNNIKEISDKDSIYCLYAGSFLPGIREPHFMVKAFCRLIEKNPHIKLIMFGNLGYNDFFAEITRTYPDNIFVHNPIPKEELQSIISQSQILINIGNFTEGFIPSKIYDYITTGKPIITFSYTGDINATLKQYPLHLQINVLETSLIEAEESLNKFILCNRNQIVEQDNLKKIYYQHTREAYEQTLDEIISRDER